jgi:hypothetical protein
MAQKWRNNGLNGAKAQKIAKVPRFFKMIRQKNI